jgi:hypothetical protein
MERDVGRRREVSKHSATPKLEKRARSNVEEYEERVRSMDHVITNLNYLIILLPLSN